MKKHFTILSAFLALLMVTSLISCSGSSIDILKSTEQDKTVVMKIDGIDVEYEIYRYISRSMLKDYNEEYGWDFEKGENGKDLVKKFNDDVELTLKKLYSTISISKKYGIEYDNQAYIDRVDYEMSDIYRSYDNNYASYKTDISAYYMNDAVYRFIVRNDIIAVELKDKMVDSGDINTDPDFLNSVFASDELIRVKYILISTSNGKTMEDCKKIADTVYSKLENGEDFDFLLKEYNEDTYMAGNIDGRYIQRGTLNEDFEEAAFALEVGEHSDIVETSVGYCIIKRLEKEQSFIEKNIKQLTNDYTIGQYNLTLENHMNSLSVEYTEKYPELAVFPSSDN